MGIEQGAKLVFIKDPTIEVIVVSEKKVTFDGEELSLTAITKRLLNITYAMQPTGYWLYREENLRDIYDRTYPLED